MDYRLMAHDVIELMDSNGVERSHVLGHSMGGKTAMQFALAYPSRVEKLVVADMAPRSYPPQHNKIYEALLALDLSKYQQRSEVSEALAAEIPDQSLRLFLLKMLGRRPDGTLFWQTNISSLQANSAGLRVALTAAVPFAGPTLFIRGERSDYVQDEDFPNIHGLFPRAIIHTIKGAGHWLHVDASEAFVGELLAFLS